MIITETVNIRGTDFVRNYSDNGFYIERDGIQYEEAIDPEGFNRAYTETNVPIE